MSGNSRFAVLIPAAGSGSRIGGDRPKQYVQILGESVLRHTVRVFADLEECTEVVIAIDDAWRNAAEEAAEGFAGVRFVRGGTERQHSIRNGLDALVSNPPIVLVHDAARPLVSARLIERVLSAVREHGAAIPALPIGETVKLVDSAGTILRTVPRDGLYTAQTPQGFQTDLLRRAYAHALDTGFVGTDDASLVEHLGEEVAVVQGEGENLKITWSEDFQRAEVALRKRMGERKAGI